MEILKEIKDAIEKVKGIDTVIYETKTVSPLFDYVVISTVESERQSDAVCAYIADNLEKNGISVKHIEGKNSTWVLIDVSDIIVHIFTKEEREHFQLEKLYMHLPKVTV